jgi:peptide/nickel transport system permease protein
MARFIFRSVISTVVTMLLVSVALFTLMEIVGRKVSVQILGVFATPESIASYDNQLGLDEPAWQRYTDWLIGSDWRAERRLGYSLVTEPDPRSGDAEWWAEVDGQLQQWQMEQGNW